MMARFVVGKSIISHASFYLPVQQAEHSSVLRDSLQKKWFVSDIPRYYFIPGNTPSSTNRRGLKIHPLYPPPSRLPSPVGC